MEINRVVIDTDILIDLLRNVKEVVDFIGEMERKRCLLATTIINAFELFLGAYKSKQREKNLASTKTLLRRLIILKMGLTSAQNAGRIHAELEAKGQPIGLRDAVIAAIVMTNGFSLFTGNIQHFRKVEGLNLISAPQH